MIGNLCCQGQWVWAWIGEDGEFSRRRGFFQKLLRNYPQGDHSDQDIPKNVFAATMGKSEEGGVGELCIWIRGADA